jgi:lipopolysaccharide biosynthesis regulator YciM
VAYARSLRNTNNTALAIQILEAQLNSSNLTSEQRMQARSELAIAYIINGQREKALAALEPLRGTQDEQAKLILARSLHEIAQRTNDGSYSQEAAVLYQQVLAQSPNPDPEILREAADVLSGIPGYQQLALQLYQTLAAREPNNQVWEIQQLALESQLGIIAPFQLRSRLQAALYPLPTDSLEQKQLAQALVRLDPPDPELLPIYQTLLQTVTDVPFLYFRMAQIFLQSDDLVTARQALSAYTATAQGAGDRASELLLAEIERREGNLVASAQRYNNLLASQPEPDIGQAALRGLAGVYISQNRLNDALALYDRLVAIAPQDFKTRLAQASLAYQAGRISEPQAQAVLEQWLATQPATNVPPELISLAVALPPSPQREAFYQRLLEVEPNNTSLQLRYIQTLAQRSPGQAKLLLERLIASNPNNLGTYFVQGEFAREIGDLELAVNAYQNILAQQPDNIDALSALGGVRFQQRQLDKAQALYTQALDFRPEAVPIRRSLASLTAVQDRPLAALEQLEKLQVNQLANGIPLNSAVEDQIQKLQGDFLQRRGFQPPWERYGFED